MGTHHQDHHPAADAHGAPHGEGVHEGDHVEQHERGDGGLVEQQLHGAHLELAVVGGDPDGVERAGEDAGEGEDDAETAGGLDIGVGCGQAVVVADDADARACRDEGDDGVSRQGLVVQHVVHEGHAGRQQDSRDLVEGDGGEGERQVRQDDVEGHGDGERQDIADGGPARCEEGEARPREDVQSEPCDREVECGECELGQLE